MTFKPNLAEMSYRWWFDYSVGNVGANTALIAVRAIPVDIGRCSGPPR